MLAACGIVPFYSEPEAGGSGYGTMVADGAEVGGEGEPFAGVDVCCHVCNRMRGACLGEVGPWLFSKLPSLVW